jgi:methylthioribose-1-phosphate isomerase
MKAVLQLPEVASLGAAEAGARLLEEARAMVAEDRAMSEAMARHGLELVPEGASILTHCNAGGLATGGGGTALAVIVAAHRAGKQISVYADETRPLLQGARLTAWELMREGVPVTLICDSAAGGLMARGMIDLVIVGADRITAAGDVANKVGTYSVAVLAQHHGIPFYVAAPQSTVDLSLRSGSDIPIEERDPAEVTSGPCGPLSPAGVPALNPAFDVTPHELVAAIITDRGVARPPYEETIRRLVG